MNTMNMLQPRYAKCQHSWNTDCPIKLLDRDSILHFVSHCAVVMVAIYCMVAWGDDGPGDVAVSVSYTPKINGFQRHQET